MKKFAKAVRALSVCLITFGGFWVSDTAWGHFQFDVTGTVMVGGGEGLAFDADESITFSLIVSSELGFSAFGDNQVQWSRTDSSQPLITADLSVPGSTGNYIQSGSRGTFRIGNDAEIDFLTNSQSPTFLGISRNGISLSAIQFAGSAPTGLLDLPLPGGRGATLPEVINAGSYESSGDLALSVIDGDGQIYVFGVEDVVVTTVVPEPRWYGSIGITVLAGAVLARRRARRVS